MSILQKDFKIDFTQVPNQVINDKNISLKGKGLYLFMVSKPDFWDFTLNGLTSQLKESKTSILKTMDELIKFGYMNKIKSRKNGRQGINDYTLFLEPKNKEQCSEVNITQSTKGNITKDVDGNNKTMGKENKKVPQTSQIPPESSFQSQYFRVSNSDSENTTTSNTELSNTELSNTNKSNNLLPKITNDDKVILKSENFKKFKKKFKKEVMQKETFFKVPIENLKDNSLSISPDGLLFNITTMRSLANDVSLEVWKYLYFNNQMTIAAQHE